MNCATSALRGFLGGGSPSLATEKGPVLGSHSHLRTSWPSPELDFNGGEGREKLPNSLAEEFWERGLPSLLVTHLPSLIPCVLRNPVPELSFSLGSVDPQL